MAENHDIGDFAIDLGAWCQAHADEIKANLERVVSRPLGDFTLLRRIDVAVWMHNKGAGT